VITKELEVKKLKKSIKYDNPSNLP